MINSGTTCNLITKNLQHHLQIHGIKKNAYKLIAKEQTNCSTVTQKIKPLHFQLRTHLETLSLNVMDMAGSYLILKKP